MATSRMRHLTMKGKRPPMLDVVAARKAMAPRVVTPPKVYFIPRRVKVGPKPRRRIVARCIGVGAVGKHGETRCTRLVRFTVAQGRPSPRCGECRVLRWWRSALVREDPAAVVKIIMRLAAQGRIGR